MKTRPRLTLAWLATLAFIVACGGDPSGPPAVASIEISGLPGIMRVGKGAQLTAAVFDAKHTALVGRTVTWSTSDTAIATADAATGLVTAIAPGSATISVAVDGVKQSLSLIVLPAPVSFVVVTVDSTSLQINETAQATAVTLDDDGNMLTGRPLTWASSNFAVASISALGVVTAIRPGTTSISASAEGASGPAVQLTVTRGNPRRGAADNRRDTKPDGGGSDGDDYRLQVLPDARRQHRSRGRRGGHRYRRELDLAADHRSEQVPTGAGNEQRDHGRS